MMKRFFLTNWNQYVLWRDKWIVQHEIAVKWLTAVLLLLTSAGLLLDEYRVFTLPQFYHFSAFDAWIWALLTACQAVGQLWLLRCFGSLKCQIWAAVLLQWAGLSLVVIGGMFITKYPPFSWLMVLFIVFGFLIGLAGNTLNKRARQDFNGVCANEMV